MKEVGYGKGYQYAHDLPDRIAADMPCLPENLADRRYYQPTDEGLEKKFRERLEDILRHRGTEKI
jgi:putative ATPase